MSKFYTHIHAIGDNILVRGYDKGLRVKFKDPYKPYLFVKAQDRSKQTHQTLDGKPVAKVDFPSMREARDFVDQYKDVGNFEIYGLNNFPYLYIYDNYKGNVDYDPSLINVVTLDIECGGDDIVGYPNIDVADQPITAITIHLRGKTATFGIKDFEPKSSANIYVKCVDEYDLLQKFLEVWESDAWSPDILTGWNIEFFDIPYLVNRIKFLFNEREAKRLSPWGYINAKTMEFRGKENKSYDLIGISVLDYYQLYRKFSYKNQESYKLDYIALVELGEQKVDYSEYGTLNNLYKQNPQLYIEYNIHDVMLVQKLDDKMKLIEQAMAMAFDAKVNLADVMTTVRPWDVYIHNYLMEQNTVIPFMKRNHFDGGLMGGFVKEPKLGLSRWVVSFDLNSLYPHLIMQYNISPETFIVRLDKFQTIDDLLEGNLDKGIRKILEQNNYTVAANGCVYSKNKQGFLPALMARLYNDRVKYKKLMLEAKQRYEDTKSYEDAKLVARYHNMQQAMKILLNSAYGALANQYFRWFNFDLAESVTSSGQLSIRWIEKKMNLYMNKLCKTENVDYVIASDTDSIYVTFESIIPKDAPELEAVEQIDKFCERYIQPYLDQCYEELAGMMLAYDQKMKMKRETIANKGIWRGKKMYILNAWNIEGVQYKEPVLKLQGIEAVRSSTPYVCRQKIKDALSIIMNGTQSELQQFIFDFKEEFFKLPFADVSFPRSIKGMVEYGDAASIYRKSTPIQVKGALLFNWLLKKKGIKTIQPITDGDKVKFAYLKMPNPIHDTVIACPEDLPTELGLDKYIDYETQFNKSFLEPLKSITDVIDWELEARSTLEDFFG